MATDSSVPPGFDSVIATIGRVSAAAISIGVLRISATRVLRASMPGAKSAGLAAALGVCDVCSALTATVSTAGRGPPFAYHGPAINRSGDAFSMTVSTATQDYKVADIGLADFGRKEIALAEVEMPGLMLTRKEFGSEQPLRAPGSPARCT